MENAKKINNKDIVREIQKQLLELQDKKYKAFHSKLIPNINPDTVIGVRTPILRKYAKEIKVTEEAGLIMKALPHKYYEENNLHGFLIEQIKDYHKCVEALDEFLPYVDNWATCDSMTPKVFKKHLPQLLSEIDRWIVSEHTYMVRFAIEMLMKFFLDDEFDVKYPDMIASVISDEYYINMMIAWYFATALAKQYESVVPYLEEGRLSLWVHNKTIQKAVESYRITDEQKAYLRSLKRKE